VYDASIGTYSYYPTSGTLSQNTISNPFAVSQRVSLDYTFGRIRIPPLLFVDNSIGLSIYQIWVPSGDLGSYGASGNSFGAILRYKMGF
jgi:hypothetical protein